MAAIAQQSASRRALGVHGAGSPEVVPCSGAPTSCRGHCFCSPGEVGVVRGQGRSRGCVEEPDRELGLELVLMDGASRGVASVCLLLEGGKRERKVVPGRTKTAAFYSQPVGAALVRPLLQAVRPVGADDLCGMLGLAPPPPVYVVT